MKLGAVGLLIGALAVVAQDSAEVAYQAARQKLEAGDAAAAEASARTALAESLQFVPEREIEVAPEKGILFDDMILEARASYRTRRAPYFRALGDALAAQEKWRASRKAYARAVAMAPDPEVFLIMADDEDLSVGERRDYLLDAYLAMGADRLHLEGVLLETGIFRSRNALKASLDGRRFSELQAEYPDLELVPGALPLFQTVTDGGTLNTGELYRQGSLVFIYVPVDTCAHCSEQLDGITVPVMQAQRAGTPVVLTAFVPEAELPIARRIVRLLAMRLGVGRLEGLPAELEFAPGGELRIVARGGMTQIRIPMSPDISSGEIRRRVDSIVSFLNAPDLPSEEKPEEASIQLVTLDKQVNELRMFYDWVDKLEKLEAGPAPLDDLYEALRQLNQRLARESESRDLGFDMMEALGRLHGASASKTRTFSMLGADIGDRLLEDVRALDPDVRRTAPPGQGVFYVAVTPEREGAPDSADARRVVMQRSFQTDVGLRAFNFLLEDTGDDLSVLWLAPEEDEPRGVHAVGAGAVFHYADGPDCEGLRLAGSAGVVYEDCTASLIDGDIVEIRAAIVDEFPDGPHYYRRNVNAGPEEAELEKGLRLFQLGDMAGAAAAFEAAMGSIDPNAPYDATDLIYNRARALEELGQRQQALALYRSVGDAAYQYLVDEGAGRIEGAPR